MPIVGGIAISLQIIEADIMQRRVGVMLIYHCVDISKISETQCQGADRRNDVDSSLCTDIFSCADNALPSCRSAEYFPTPARSNFSNRRVFRARLALHCPAA